MGAFLADVRAFGRQAAGLTTAGAPFSLLLFAASQVVAQPIVAEPPGSLVEVCEGEVGGFFRVPGTDTCLRIGGEVYTQASAAHGNEVSITPGREDDRPVASHDTVPVGDEFRGFASHGEITVRTQTGTEQGVLHTVVRLRGTTASSQLMEAYLHWAGLTAGYHRSFFDVHTGYNETAGLSSDRTTNLLAYTFRLRPTLTITVSAEDATFRRFQEGQWAQYAGQRLPDVVAAVDYDPDEGWWFHAAAAAHHIEDQRAGSGSSFGFAGNVGTGQRFRYSDSSTGRFVVTGAYARGALDYLGIPANAPDYIRDEFGRLHLSEGYSALASYEHYWTTEIRTAATASFYRTWTEAGSLDWTTEGFWLTLGADYIPIPGFTLGLDVTYYRDAVWGAGPDQDPRTVAESVVGYGYARRVF